MKVIKNKIKDNMSELKLSVILLLYYIISLRKRLQS